MSIKLLEKIKRLFAKEAIEEPNYPICRSVVYIPCDRIRPAKLQPRADFNQDSSNKLAESIRRFGVIQPIAVKKADIDDIYEYELISGERRLRAAKSAKLYSIPCMVFDVGNRTAAEMSIIENISREELNPFELGYGIYSLYEDFGMTQEEISRHLSLENSFISNKLRLLKLTYEEQCAVLEANLSESHAKLLSKLSSHESRVKAIQLFKDTRMSQKEAKEYIDFLKSQPGEATDIPPLKLNKPSLKFIRDLEKRIEFYNKSGGQASIKTRDGFFEVDIHIAIKKSSNVNTAAHVAKDSDNDRNVSRETLQTSKKAVTPTDGNIPHEISYVPEKAPVS